MRQLAVLAAVMVLASATRPRLRRQAELTDLKEYTPCKGDTGVCVPYYLCNNGSLVTDGAGVIDIRIGGSPDCPQFLDYCCSKPQVLPPPPPPPPPPAYVSSCGRRNTQGIDVRIQGFKGNETQVGEFPWMTAVLKKEIVSGEEINLYLCGGSLIHPSIVMTAAHCVYKHASVATNLRVRLGEWDTQNEYEPYKHEDRDVQALTIHPLFNPSNLHNDYALLYLKSPVTLSRNVDVICLDNNLSILSPLHDCVVTGWGKDKFGKEGIFQNVLKQISLPYYDFNKCQAALRTTRLGAFFKLDPSFLCAGGEAGKDSCSGDGGSPLVCLDAKKTQYVQIGMVAWGIGCGTANIPGVYVNVVAGYDWIVAEADKLLAGQHKPAIEYWNYA